MTTASDINLFYSYQKMAEKYGIFVESNSCFTIRLENSSFDFVELKELTAFIDGYIFARNQL